VGYLTPSGLEGDIVVSITIPSDPYFLYALTGAITSLTDPENWEQYGTLTPQEAAAKMLQAYQTITQEEA